MRFFLTGIIIVTAISFSFSQEVPYREASDFKVFSSFQLISEKPKKKPAYTASSSKQDTQPKMHLNLRLKILNVKPEETRLISINSEDLVIHRKKVKEAVEIEINFGEFERVKNHEIPYLFTIFIQSNKRQNLNKIKIEVLESGALFVNDQPHGKN